MVLLASYRYKFYLDSGTALWHCTGLDWSLASDSMSVFQHCQESSQQTISLKVIQLSQHYTIQIVFATIIEQRSFNDLIVKRKSSQEKVKEKSQDKEKDLTLLTVF